MEGQEMPGQMEPVKKEKMDAVELEKLELIRDQWIPELERILTELSEGEVKNGYEEKFTIIKADFEKFEKIDLENTDITAVEKELDDIYARAELLFGQVEISLDEEKQAVDSEKLAL